MRARLERGAEDKRLCIVTFEMEPENPDTLVVECIYEYRRPAEENYQIEGDPCFLEMRSVTRTDTRETVSLSPEQKTLVENAVANEVAHEYGAL